MTSNTINDSLDLNPSSGEDASGQNSDLSPQAPRPTRVARPDAEKLPIEIARLLSDSRCTDVIILDVRGLIDVQDFIVIASGTSERQIRAVSHQVKDLVEANGQGVYRTSADSDARWIVIDCVDVVVHLLEPNERSFRDFESMWGDAPRLAWQREGEAARQAQARQGPMSVPLKTDAPRVVESAFAPVERVEPASTPRVNRAKASVSAAEGATTPSQAAADAPQVRKKPRAARKSVPAKRGVSKAKAKAKAAAKADGTTAKRRTAAKQVKRAATKAAGKGTAKKATKRVAKKAGQRKDKPMVKSSAKKTAKKAPAKTASARGAATKSGGRSTKRKPAGK